MLPCKMSKQNVFQFIFLLKDYYTHYSLVNGKQVPNNLRFKRAALATTNTHLKRMAGQLNLMITSIFIKKKIQ